MGVTTLLVTASLVGAFIGLKTNRKEKLQNQQNIMEPNSQEVGPQEERWIRKPEYTEVPEPITPKPFTRPGTVTVTPELLGAYPLIIAILNNAPKTRFSRCLMA